MDPIVLVIIEEPLVTVEMIADVVMAEEEVVVGTVIVDVYDMYFPVGVACSSPRHDIQASVIGTRA